MKMMDQGTCRLGRSTTTKALRSVHRLASFHTAPATGHRGPVQEITHASGPIRVPWAPPAANVRSFRFIAVVASRLLRSLAAVVSPRLRLTPRPLRSTPLTANHPCNSLSASVHGAAVCRGGEQVERVLETCTSLPSRSRSYRKSLVVTSLLVVVSCSYFGGCLCLVVGRWLRRSRR